MSSKEKSLKEAQNLVGKRLGSRVVTGYIYTKIGNRTRNLYLTVVCDCGRKSLISKTALLRRGYGKQGCRACSLITKGITELEARNKLRELETMEIDR